MATDHSDTEFAGARRAMIDSQLRPSGVTDKALLAAFDTVRREDFLPDARRAVAYRDRAIDLGNGRQALAPTPLGKLLDRAEPRPGERALSVGPLAAYTGALLAHMGCDVVALDSEKADGPDLERLTVKAGDLCKGHAEGGPYDLILVNGAIEQFPATLVDQLAEDGRVATGIWDDGIARLAIGRRSGDQIGFRHFADAQMTRLPAFDRKRGFQF